MRSHPAEDGQGGPAPVASVGGASRRWRVVLLAVCWAFAVAAGAAQSWNGRFAMNPDGISYLEVGEAFWRFDLAAAVNGHWAPLYPIVLGFVDALLDPSAAWEFQVVQLANFLVYLLALGALNLLLLELIGRDRRLSERQGRQAGVPVWAYLVIGHAMFVWATTHFTRPTQVNNDLLSLALLLLVAAVFVRAADRGGRIGPFVLGCAVGLSYLNKLAALYPGLLFVAGLALTRRTSGRAWRAAGLALLGCALVAAPFVGALSLQKGRLTPGDKGRLAYAWTVNEVEWIAHWQGEPEGSGVPAHPTRRLAEHPAVFEFASPIGGTYPPWYDPSYWYEGLEVRFDASRQWRRIREHTWPQLRRVFRGRPVEAVLWGAAALALAATLLPERRRIARRALVVHLTLALPALATLLMYLPVLVRPRYCGGALLLLGLALLSAFRWPRSRWRRRAAGTVLAAFLLLMVGVVGPPLRRGAGRAIGDIRENGVADLSAHVHLTVAERLRAAGLAEGDRIAHIGNSQIAYWARLARLGIVAEIPYRRASRWKRDHVREFMRLDEADRAGILERLASPGVRAIVASRLPTGSRISGGRRLPEEWKVGWTPIVRPDERLFRRYPGHEDRGVYLLFVER